MRNQRQEARGFTGWHMLGLMGLFFGTIILVNVVMAWNALSSWSGLVVGNGYVASQAFNGKVAAARALAASGISGRLAADIHGLRYTLVDRDGRPLETDAVIATLKRPVDERADFILALQPAGDGTFAAAHAIGRGQWIVDLVATRSGEEVFRETLRILVAGGGR